MTAFLISTENALFETRRRSQIGVGSSIGLETGFRLQVKRFAIPFHWQDAQTACVSISVSIVEDSEQLRGTLARVIGRADGFKCVSQYPSAEAAIEGLPNDRPDVVLMDINLPGMNGVECVRRVKQLLPQTLVVMLTAYEDTENIFNSLAAGASGYMLKRTKSTELLEAIQDVLKGGSPMTAHIARKVVQSFQQTGPSNQATENLSPREQEVLDCLSQGFLYKEIAEKLGISYETVHTYIRRIYEKLQVRTRTEAVAKFLRR
jgi:DNA-binding NarL/FixJ family response regulator